MSLSSSDELLTAAEVAARIGTHPRTILRWREEGLIPAEVARGSFIRFDLAKVREALRQDAAKR